MSVVSLKGVCLLREGKPLLHDINWEIEKGQHWAFIGQNGSGKSLTLKIISGYLWASKGEVSVLDKRFGSVDLRELRKKIGWVSLDLQYQFQGSYPVKDVVLSGYFASIGLFDEPPADIVDRAKSLLKDLGCEALLDRSFATLSFGEQKRVLIARALLCEPQVLILDEPCAGLDLLAREHFLQTIQSLGEDKSGPTIIFVTHHVEEIMPFVTHCYAIKGGKEVTKGTKETVLSEEVLRRTLDVDVSLRAVNNRYWVDVR